ncbi:MAG TPA: EAL domain-containing protein [Arenimonas sp.]|uniref:putative bifunctional diguanylate cyclase/phosphodiesterase n=1 Tax=Arenimonas sp. TaxID=1872635 RepID=UPI002D80A5AD|nr:EAL domain-containing protein [Arenimonas sp.]HEU0151855.1 EAL domain-containing protein [Arenimonas sp.]
MMHWRLQTRIVALLILLVLAAQLATFAVVNVATGRSVSGQLEEELVVAERVWQRFYDARSRQLLESTLVLADDFGFKAAVASGDAATMASALRNQAARVGADAAVLLGPDGDGRAALAGTDPVRQAQALAPLLAQARAEGFALSVVDLDGRLHVMALLPVLAPNQIGWVAIGSTFGDDYAGDFRALTGIHASFASPRDRTLQVYGSSLAPGARAALGQVPPASLAPDRRVRPMDLAGDRYFALAEPLAGSASVNVVLQGSLDEAMAPYATLKDRILLLSGLAALVALVLAGLLGRGISRPVVRLAEAAQRIQAGDYSQPIEARGRDEISGLASALGHMQQGIAAREARILHQANHDALTGLPNRARARDHLEQALATPHPDGHACAVLMLDLDRFKEINDTLGHGFGDQVLQEVGKRLRLAVRPEDLVARLGGDEFMVIMRDVEREHVPRRARLLLEQLREPLDLPSTRINLDCSIGLVLSPDHGEDAQTLLRRADIALYDAKHARSGVAVYQPGRDEVHLRQLTLMGDLRQSVARGELRLKFQPKVDLASRSVHHVEALLRWQHPTLGAVPPDEFIPLAERSGFVHELTRFVVEEALRQNAKWRAEGLDLGMAINLSAMDLMDADLPDFIHDCQRRHQVPPAKIILEVTEGALMRDVDYAVRMLHRLRAGGIRLSIDDFGTGYSSLAQLKRMPVDELKIDKSFVMQMTEGSDDAVIVRSTIELGHNMGLAVIAEGVESDSSLQLLRKYRCDMVQGYFFSPPIEAGELAAWCQRFAGAEA